MIRRDFFKTPLAVAGLTLGGTTSSRTWAAPAVELAKAPGLTRYVAEFIVNTKYEDIPEDVLILGKKTMLDGFGLALAGSVSGLGPRIRQYIEITGLGEREIFQHYRNDHEGSAPLRVASERRVDPRG